MTNSKINAETANLPVEMRVEGVNYQNNIIASERIMLSQQNGAIFLLMNEFISDNTSRIGGSGDPSAKEGKGGYSKGLSNNYSTCGLVAQSNGGTGYSGGEAWGLVLYPGTGTITSFHPGSDGSISIRHGLKSNKPLDPKTGLDNLTLYGKAGSSVCAFLKHGSSDLKAVVNTGGIAGGQTNFGAYSAFYRGSGGESGSFFICEVI